MLQNMKTEVRACAR